MVRDSNKECQGVENVPDNQLERELVDPKASADPGEESVNPRVEFSTMRHSKTVVHLRGDQGQHRQDVGSKRD